MPKALKHIKKTLYTALGAVFIFLGAYLSASATETTGYINYPTTAPYAASQTITINTTTTISGVYHKFSVDAWTGTTVPAYVQVLVQSGLESSTSTTFGYPLGTFSNQSFYAPSRAVDGCTNTNTTSDEWTIGTTPSWVEFSYGTPIVLPPGFYRFSFYVWGANSTSTCGNDFVKSHTFSYDTSDFIDGGERQTRNVSTMTSNAPSDLLFMTRNDVESNVVYQDYPLTGQVSDFEYFLLTYYLPAKHSTSSVDFLCGNYSKATSTTIYQDCIIAEDILGSGKYVLKTHTLEYADWNFWASLEWEDHDAYGNLTGSGTYTSSSVVTSSISKPLSPTTYLEIPTSTASSSDWVTNCDPDAGVVSYSICYVLRFLFIPKTGDLDNFSYVYDSIKDKPPFGYFYSIKSAVQTLSASSTPAYVIASSSPANIYVFSPVRTMLSVVMYLMAGFWVFGKFRNLTL